MRKATARKISPPAPEKTAPSRRTTLLAALAIFAAVWLLSANSLSNGFAFDDKGLITRNRFLVSKPPLPTVFSTSYRAGAGLLGDGLYRPLVILSLMANGNPANPFPFHLFNVTLNALVAALFFLFLLAVSGNLPLAAAAAVVFGFHPLHTEAVANVAGRPELMCLFFILGAWIALEKYRDRVWAPGAAAALLLAALLSKETAIVFPAMVIAADFARGWPLFSVAGARRYLPLIAIAGIYLVIRAHVLAGAPDMIINFIENPLVHAPLGERIPTAFLVLAKYAGLLVLPLRLSSDYSFNAIPAVTTLANPAALIGLAIFLASAAALFLRRKPLIALAAGMFFFPYLLVSNLVIPIGTIMGERLMYLPSMGFALGLALLVTPALTRKNVWVTAGFAALLLCYSGRTLARNPQWHDDLTLLTADVKTVSNDTKVFAHLGMLTPGEQGMVYLRRALEIMPENDDALRGYGCRLYEQGQTAAAYQCFSRAVEIAPNNASTHNDFGVMFRLLGKYPEAERELTEAIRLNPYSPNTYIELGMVQIAMDRYQEALASLGKAAELGGNEEVILKNSAVAHFLAGNFTAAYRVLRTAEAWGVRLDPELAAAIRAAVNQTR